MLYKPDKEDEYFLANIRNMIDAASDRGYPQFSAFMDERKQVLAANELHRQHVRCCLFYGGFDDAVRRMLCVYPDYMSENDLEFPVDFLHFTYRNADNLSHRDFLGALMSLQLKREAIGDIYVTRGEAWVVLMDTLASHVASEVRLIGRVGVAVQLAAPPKGISTVSYQEIMGTVSSFRIDCIAAFLTNQSRSKTIGLISAGNIFLNYQQIDSPAVLIQLGDIITIRGYGKFVFHSLSGKTKKGRHHIIVKKYI